MTISGYEDGTYEVTLGETVTLPVEASWSRRSATIAVEPLRARRYETASTVLTSNKPFDPSCCTVWRIPLRVGERLVGRRPLSAYSRIAGGAR